MKLIKSPIALVPVALLCVLVLLSAHFTVTNANADVNADVNADAAVPEGEEEDFSQYIQYEDPAAQDDDDDDDEPRSEFADIDSISDDALVKRCEKNAQDDKCGEPDTAKFCAKICDIWERKQKMQPRTVWVDIDREDFSFFDLTAKRVTDQKWINFERFEGYLTVVANVGRICESKEDIEFVTTAMKSLFKIMPYSLNIVLFPHKIPSIAYDGINCEEYDSVIAAASADPELKEKLYIMEDAVLNGPDAHPVYEYLKKSVDLEPMLETHSTFFFVSGEGNKVDLFQGASFSQLRGHIVRISKSDFLGIKDEF